MTYFREPVYLSGRGFALSENNDKERAAQYCGDDADRDFRWRDHGTGDGVTHGQCASAQQKGTGEYKPVVITTHAPYDVGDDHPEKADGAGDCDTGGCC